jgi:hypothetical protein
VLADVDVDADSGELVCTLVRPEGSRVSEGAPASLPEAA